MADTALGIGMITKTTRDQVDVDVKDTLTRSLTTVDTDVKTVNAGISRAKFVAPDLEQFRNGLSLFRV